MENVSHIEIEKADPLVIVIMATYNGEKYLEDQLDSIIDQTWRNWKLIVRDDGSSDNTLKILDSYKKNDTRIEVMCDEKKNLGICMNFAELMENSLIGDYVMFSDQDDIWLPDKIRATYNVMKDSELRYGKNVPLLVHTDLHIVDENLKTIANSAEKYINLQPCLPNKLSYLLAQNFIYGCTTMMNRALLKNCLPVPIEAENHDYWVSLIAASLGRIVYLPNAHILYRQHSLNYSGGISGGKLINRINRITLGWKEFNNIIDMRIRQGFALLSRVEDRLPENERKMLTEFLSTARYGGLSAVITAFKHKISRQGKIRTIVFYMGLIKKRNIGNV